MIRGLESAPATERGRPPSAGASSQGDEPPSERRSGVPATLGDLPGYGGKASGSPRSTSSGEKKMGSRAPATGASPFDARST